jgi:hypothetical protein
LKNKRRALTGAPFGFTGQKHAQVWTVPVYIEGLTCSGWHDVSLSAMLPSTRNPSNTILIFSLDE